MYSQIACRKVCKVIYENKIVLRVVYSSGRFIADGLSLCDIYIRVYRFRKSNYYHIRLELRSSFTGYVSAWSGNGSLQSDMGSSG